MQQLNFYLTAKQKANALLKMELKGKVSHLLTPAGDIDFYNLLLAFDAHADQLPLTLLCNFACLEPKLRNQLEALIGETLNLNAHAELKQMNGPLLLDIAGDKGKIKLDGALARGILTLNKPFVAEIAVTPKLSESVLQDVAPFLSSALSAEKPLRIVIDPDGFALPLVNFNLTGITIERAMLDLGKIEFSSEGQIGQILSVLQAVRSRSSDTLNVWFTPLYFGMKSGIIKVNRLDMLLTGLYPVALWGKIYIPDDQVDLRIGLSALALQESFGIKGLSSDDMMVLPFTGPVADASIDKGKAATKITSLIAQGQGGTKGKIFGSILQIIGGGLDDDHVPAPTTQPLPWEGQMKQLEAADPEAERPRKQKKESVFKQIEKEASSLLEMFK